MSLIDSKLEFCSKQDVTGVDTNGVYSENIIDLGLEENHLSGNRHGAGYLNVNFVEEAVEPASANIFVHLEHSNDGATGWDVAASCSVLANTERCCTIKLPKALRRFIRLKYTSDDEIEAGKVDAYIGAPLANH
jgi:hypothetical protein